MLAIASFDQEKPPRSVIVKSQAIVDRRIPAVTGRQLRGEIRGQRHRQRLPALVERAGKLRLSRERQIVFIAVYNRARRCAVQRRRDVHEMQTVVRPEPNVGDDEIERDDAQARTGGLEGGVRLDVRERADRRTQDGARGVVRLDEQNVPSR